MADSQALISADRARKHLFTYRDVVRIIRAVDVAKAPGQPSEEAILAVAAAQAAISDFFSSLADLTAPAKALWATRVALDLTAAIWNLASDNGVRIASLVSQILTRLDTETQ